MKPLPISLLLPLRSTLLVFTCPAPLRAADWVDVSTPLLERLTKEGAKTEWPGGCSGVVANRLTGEVTMKVVGLGLWRSADEGKTWKRIDGEKVSGRDETGWATSVDQARPARMGSFSLDGAAGWTADGTAWRSFATLGRNWDYGSVDWSAVTPLHIIAAKHETTPPGEVYASSDGGVSWRQLPVHLQEKRNLVSMVGALGGQTYIYSNGDGIQRSTDGGTTWTKAAQQNPQTRIPMFMDGAHYLGTDAGLLVSRDRGATWQPQGAPVDVWQGPFFGRDAREMAIVGKDGIFLTKDAGTTWRKAADLKPDTKGFSFSPKWFGCYAWDAVHGAVYVSAMGNPLYRLQLSQPLLSTIWRTQS